MVEIIYKISDGSSYTDKLEAYRNEFKWLRNRRDSLLKSLVRAKQESLPRFTKKYLSERAKVRIRMEDVRRNDDPKRKYLVRQAYYEELAKKFEALNDLQIEIRVYKKMLAEYKERDKDCKKVLELYKAVEEHRELVATYGVQEKDRSQ